MDALIGHTGFVGGNLCAQHEFGAFYNSKNIGEIEDRAFDTLVFSGAQAKKWWANQNPEADRASIENAVGHMRRVAAKRLVVISTIDVLPQQPQVDEDFDCGSVLTHAYGENRLYLERTLSAMFEKVNIVRLPALFGPGLKKNVIYDLMTDNILETINPDSEFQYYDLTRLWSDIELIAVEDLGLIHLFTEPLSTRRILDAYFPEKVVGEKAAPTVRYDFRTKHDRLFGRNDGYIESADEVMKRLGAFIAGQRV